jgi:hypothetical protein
LAKIPIDAKTGHLADVNNLSHMTTCNTACEYYTTNRADGIGFCFTAADEFAGVDLDLSLDQETGRLTENAAEIVDTFSTYCEVSPSGTGVKLVMRGRLPGSGRRKSGIEVYDRGRYFALTGHRLDQAPATIQECQAPLSQLYGWLTAPSQKFDSPPAVGRRQPCDAISQGVVERALSARNGEKFRRLWAGDWAGYPSRSEADLALLRLLSFQVGPDPERLDKLFRKCGLMRPKWDSADYGRRTIGKILSTPGPTSSPTPPGEVIVSSPLPSSPLEHTPHCAILYNGATNGEGNCSRLEGLYEQARREPLALPAGFQVRVEADRPRLEVLHRLVERLHAKRGGKPFGLGGATHVASLFHVGKEKGKRWLRSFVEQGLLREAVGHSTQYKRVRQYWYMGDQLAQITSV